MKDDSTKIHQAALKFLVPLSPFETFKLIGDEARSLANANFGSILLEQNGELVKVYAYPDTLYKVKNRRRGLMYKVFSSDKPAVLDISKYGSVHPLYKRIGVKSTMGIPLSYKHKTIGVLTLHSTENSFFTPGCLPALTLFSSFATLAIRKTQLYDETKKALEMRDQFIALAAYQLKNPMSTINDYVQLLNDMLSSKIGSQSRWVKELSWETNRLTELVNEFLAIDQIKTGKLKYLWREIRLKEIIKKAVTAFNFAHSEHQILFENKADSDFIMGDFDKLLQVVTNLLNNAAKFSPPNSEITITLENKSPYIILTIEDQGVGISKRDLARIFEKFYRGQNNKREGMGLGLYLVKNIITEHKGKISLSSKKNAGVIVKIELPEAKNA